MNGLQKYILDTLHYFSFFHYAPTFDEVYTFLAVKTGKTTVKKVLGELVEKKIVKQLRLECDDSPRYTPGEYAISQKSLELKVVSSRKKVKSVQKYIQILAQFPQIKLIGLSGSVAMMNAKQNDDIDLFIITDKHRLWTGRMLSIGIAHVLGVRRSRGQQAVENKICLNLFFDDCDLSLPIAKQTRYGAHEVLQMKPLVNKHQTYEKFISANAWAFKLFPNARRMNQRRIIGENTGIGRSPGNILETVFKYIQLRRIRKHQTTELVTDTQLWFFPDDFEKKLTSDGSY